MQNYLEYKEISVPTHSIFLVKRFPQDDISRRCVLRKMLQGKDSNYMRHRRSHLSINLRIYDHRAAIRYFKYNLGMTTFKPMELLI